MKLETWKVGEVARRTGLTVRALHHFDEIGLLAPSHRGAGGQRLYTRRDLGRLQRVLVLRRFGVALDAIRRALDEGGGTGLRELLANRRAEIEKNIENERAIAARLEALEERLAKSDEADWQDLIDTQETLDMIEKHYSPEQMEQLKQRADAVGPEAIAAAQREWPELIAKMRAALDEGVPPDDARIAPLARRWKELVEAFTGGDPGITRSLSNVYEKEPGFAEKQGLDTALFDYVRRAQESLGE